MMEFDFLLVQPQAFIEKKKPRLRRKDWTRVYLKTPNAPGQRAFLRCAASFFLEIRQYSCEKMSCATQKSLAAGHIMSFQIHPRTKQICPPVSRRACFMKNRSAGMGTERFSAIGELLLEKGELLFFVGLAGRVRDLVAGRVDGSLDGLDVQRLVG